MDHSTLNCWVLAYASQIERRLRYFRKPPCGSVRVDEMYIKVPRQWRPRGPADSSTVIAWV